MKKAYELSTLTGTQVSVDIFVNYYYSAALSISSQHVCCG